MERVKATQRPPASKFRRLAITHALMMGGDAAMVVALADSLFFDIDLDAARSRVLLFLVIGFAPFLVVAPLIGPLIDRVAGGRKFVIQVVALSRVVLTLLMAQYLDALALFPLVFASLVLQKTYAVSKSAIVPSTVRSEAELVEANSKLGLIAGITGAVAVIPAGLLLQVVGAPATLVYGAMLFVGALVAATRLSSDVVAPDAADAEETSRAALVERAARRDRHDGAARSRRLHLLPSRVLAPLAGPGHAVVRRCRGCVRARLHGGQRGGVAAAGTGPRGDDAHRRAAGVRRGRSRRLGARRTVRCGGAGGRVEPDGRIGQAELREHRAA